MLLLVCDTSGKNGSVGLARGDSSAVEVIESVPLAGGTFSAQLVPQIAELLAKHGFGKKDIGAFIAVSGPGSFTGLRVGLAAIKALAEVLKKPIVPVSLLEAIAMSGGATNKIVAAIDAGRGEVYVGEYDGMYSRQEPREQLLTKEEFEARVRGSVFATPDEALAKLAGAGAIQVPMPDSEVIARAGWRRLQAGQTVTPEELEANYIRRSDAEMFSKGRP
jgi:tRNA threonylcarbamoyladenosine biosynthesis protein TsaB